jgi:glutaredoxin
MDYLLFTYPNCHKCDALKAFFAERGLAKQEYDVTLKEGRMKIRDFLRSVVRDDKGSIILPTLMCVEGGRVEAVLNTREDFEAWLRSRA